MASAFGTDLEVRDDGIPLPMSVDDEQRRISFLYVKPGKIGGWVRSREKSEVWTCFGELCYRDPELPADAAVTDAVVSLDATRHYCMMCLENVKNQPEPLRDINQLQSYSTATSTATLAEHLNTKHDIQLSKNVTDDQRGKRKQNNETLVSSLMTMSSTLSVLGIKDLNEDFMLWLAQDMEPLSMVKNNGLNYFFNKNFSFLCIPDESTLWRKHVVKLYRALVSSVKADLASVSSVGLKFQGWTDKSSGVYYIGLRAQFIQEDWTGKTVTLSIKPCAEDVDSIMEHLKKEIGIFIPEYADKELYATHDGTDAMIKASEALNVKSWNCGIEHALHHLLEDDSLEQVSSIMSVLHKSKLLVRTLYDELDALDDREQNSCDQTVGPEFIESIINLNKLLQAEFCYLTKEVNVVNVEADSCCQLADCDSFRLDEFTGDRVSEKFDCWSPKDVLINWISSLEMINSLLSLRCEVMLAFKLIGKTELCLQPPEWSLVQELSKFLSTFLTLNELVSTQTTSLSLIPLIRAEIAYSCKVSSENSKELCEVKTLILKNLDKRFPVTSSTKLATLLDPATKGLCCLSEEQKVDILYKAITEALKSSSLLDSSYLNVTVKTEADVDFDSRSTTNEKSGPISKKMKLIQKHIGASITDNAPHCKYREEIKTYLKYIADDSEDDPLAFWKKGQFPLLALLAKSILTQSALSALADNMFSTSEIHLNAKRSSLPPYRANYLSFIRENYLTYSALRL